jgi:hypothetical protein
MTCGLQVNESFQAASAQSIHTWAKDHTHDDKMPGVLHFALQMPLVSAL